MKDDKPIDLKKAWKEFLKRQENKRRAKNAGTKENIKD